MSWKTIWFNLISNLSKNYNELEKKDIENKKNSKVGFMTKGKERLSYT